MSVVKECNRLGIVVDLAHASHETVLGALKVSTQPVIVSHTSFDQRTGKNPRMAKMMAPRLISKDHAKVVADAGGVIGVWTKLSDSMGEYVAGIKALADAVGIDHVGIGSDTDILSPRTGQIHQRRLVRPVRRILQGGRRGDAAPGLHTRRDRQDRRRKLLPGFRQGNERPRLRRLSTGNGTTIWSREKRLMIIRA